MTIKKNTTVSISSKHDEVLAKLTIRANVSKKEYIEKGLEYFQKFGINPIEFDSPSDEMKKLIKKIDQVIGFIRVQERDILKPACSTLIQNSQSMNREIQKLDDIATNKQVLGIVNKLYALLKKQNDEFVQNLETKSETQKEAILELVKVLDEKRKLGISDKIKDLFS